MNVLVTGATGFLGRHLTALLVERGYGVFGLTRHPVPAGAAGIRWLRADLGDTTAVANAIARAAPERVFHLAARTPANCGDAVTAAEWLRDGAVATHHLLEALYATGRAPRVLLASSSAVYGHVPLSEQPIVEQRPLRPVTLYGVAKATAEMVGGLFTAKGLPTIVARPFNLLGPGEPTRMLTSHLARQVAGVPPDAKTGKIRVRHLATSRDYTDVRDAARALVLAIEHGPPGTAFNVCSGRATPASRLVDVFSSLRRVRLEVEETGPGPTPDDVASQVGDGRKLEALTGWTPEIPLERSLGELLASHECDPARADSQ